MAKKSTQEKHTASGPVMDEGKKAVLDKAVGDILKRYGEGSIMRLGDAHTMVTEIIPTGSLSLDIALGVGGVPRGRITEIYGPESSGKTTLCQHIVAETQKMGGTAAYIDMEHALDPTYAAKCGVDIDNLLVSQPDTGEQASKSSRPSSAPAAWTSWWSTRSRRSCRAPRSKATWATPPWASRRAS